MDLIKIVCLGLSGAVGVNIYLDGLLKDESLIVACIVFILTAIVSFLDVFSNKLFLIGVIITDVCIIAYLFSITGGTITLSFILFVLFLAVSLMARIADN